MIAPILLPQEPVLAAQNEQDVSDAFTFDEICNMGEVQIEPIRPNQPEDLTTIIYTSGSTGSLPKGAAVHDSMWWDLITANLGNFDPIVTICKGSLDCFLLIVLIARNDCYGCTDPLVHISERELLQNTLVNGGRMGFTTEPDRVFEDIKSLGPIRVDSTPRFVSQALR
jgi:long-subunit acyl-CoA synthetase (AMP-forming)